MNPEVSVIIPVHNRLHLLPDAVESVLAQTLPVSEIILIDDGSTRHTPEMVEQMIQERESWRRVVRYFYQDNQGVSGALNHGIAEARAEWIAFNADDDCWFPQKLEWQFRALGQFKTESAACFTDAEFMTDSGPNGSAFDSNGLKSREPIGIIQDSIRFALLPMPAWVQTIVVHSDLARKMEGFDPKLRYSEDLDFVFRLALETKLCFVNRPLASISRETGRHIGQNEQWARIEFRLKNNQYLFEKMLGLSAEFPSDLREVILNNLRSIHGTWENLYLQKRDYSQARRAISSAAKCGLNPRVALKWLAIWLSPALARQCILRIDQRLAK